MIGIYKFIINNWQIILTILTLITILSLIVPITNAIKASKEGVKNIFTPLGFGVFIILVGVVLVLFFKFKGMINQ